MMSLKMSSVSLNQQNNHGIMDEYDDKDQEYSNLSSCCSSEVSSNDLSSSSDHSELFGEEDGDEANSSSSDIPTSPSSGDSSLEHTKGPLQNMSSLLQELPIKRGLSKHYNGKSQSFTSLSNVSSLEDLAKPENPYNKKLKSCKSYGVMFLEGFKSEFHQSSPAKSSSFSRLNSKKNSRGLCSSLRARRNGSFLGNNRPPTVPPHRSASTTSFTNQTPLFA